MDLDCTDDSLRGIQSRKRGLGRYEGHGLTHRDPQSIPGVVWNAPNTFADPLAKRPGDPTGPSILLRDFPEALKPEAAPPAEK